MNNGFRDAASGFTRSRSVQAHESETIAQTFRDDLGGALVTLLLGALHQRREERVLPEASAGAGAGGFSGGEFVAKALFPGGRRQREKGALVADFVGGV